MEFRPLKSSRVKEVGYIEQESVLVIVFKDGREYEYDDVPNTIYSAFVHSKSPGKYFETNIKNRYSYERTK